MSSNSINIKVFPAHIGDCILINIDNTFLLIDGGYINTYKKFLKPELLNITKNGNVLSHLIISHIDADHISGVIKLLEENKNQSIIPINNIWHNAYRHIQPPINDKNNLNPLDKKIIDSILGKSFLKEILEGENEISAIQGSTLASLIFSGGYNWNDEFNGNAISTDSKLTIDISKDIKIILLSPDNKKLDKLQKYWRRELYKHGFMGTPNHTMYFDDAFEFLIAQEKERKQKINRDISSTQFEISRFKGMKFTEDESTSNGSSISFVIEYGDKKLLFLGDSHPSLIVQNIKKYYSKNSSQIKFDLIKLSHHGSFANNSPELLNLIDSENYIVSTDGKTFDHPDFETLAWILSRKTKHKKKLYFNYPLEKAQILNIESLKSRFNYDIYFSDGGSFFEINL